MRQKNKIKSFTVDKDTALHCLLNGRKYTFQKLFEEYDELENYYMNSSLYAEKFPYNSSEIFKKFISENDFLVNRAHLFLGAKKVKALKYRRGIIKKEFERVEQYSYHKPLIKDRLNYSVGDKLKESDVVKSLQSAYDALKIDRKAKATDMKWLYGVSRKSVRLNGKIVKRIVINVSYSPFGFPFKTD